VVSFPGEIARVAAEVTPPADEGSRLPSEIAPLLEEVTRQAGEVVPPAKRSPGSLARSSQR
jgi:hypothetical protein